MKAQQDPRTVYEKGQHLLELRQRPLSLAQTMGVLLGTVAVVALLTFIASALLK